MLILHFPPCCLPCWLSVASNATARLTCRSLQRPPDAFSPLLDNTFTLLELPPMNGMPKRKLFHLTFCLQDRFDIAICGQVHFMNLYVSTTVRAESLKVKMVVHVCLLCGSTGFSGYSSPASLPTLLYSRALKCRDSRIPRLSFAMRNFGREHIAKFSRQQKFDLLRS